MAIRYGADALGLVGSMPSGPGVIEDSTIRAIARQVPPPLATFLLSSETNPNGVLAHYEKVHTTAIQLVDTPLPGTWSLLRKNHPQVKIIQVIHVLNEKSIGEAVAASDSVDALLLDSGNPALKVKELGGTGRVHDWKLSKKIREAVGVPVFLAGGLNADNVQEAIEMVQPFGVDLCSGVRSSGRLDEQKLEAFFRSIGQ